MKKKPTPEIQAILARMDTAAVTAIDSVRADMVALTVEPPMCVHNGRTYHDGRPSMKLSAGTCHDAATAFVEELTVQQQTDLLSCDPIANPNRAQRKAQLDVIRSGDAQAIRDQLVGDVCCQMMMRFDNAMYALRRQLETAHGQIALRAELGRFQLAA